MIFPKLSNTQKARVIKNLGYESEESDDEVDDAQSIFLNPYDDIDLDQHDLSSLQQSIHVKSRPTSPKFISDSLHDKKKGDNTQILLLAETVRLNS